MKRMKRSGKINIDLIKKTDTLILGAGLTGLTAAWKLQSSGIKNFIVLERENRAGGLMKTNSSSMATIDELPHVFFTKDKLATSIFKRMVGDVYKHSHKLGVLWKTGYINYPFQNNINQLSLEDKKNVLQGLLERNNSPEGKQNNLEEFALKFMGSGILELFFKPYNEKLWQTLLCEMDYKWLSAKITLPDACALSDSVLGIPKKSREVSPHANFIYPKSGGIESLIKGFVKKIKPDKFRYRAEVLKIDIKKKVVYTLAGTFKYKRLISTLPLDRIMFLTGLRKNLKSVKRLKATKVLSIQYLLKKVNLPDYHWIYVPDSKFPFYRLTREDLINPGASSGHKALIVECALKDNTRLNIESLIKKTTGHLEKLGILKKRDIKEVWHSVHFPTYAVPHIKHSEDVSLCMKKLNKAQIISAGRFAEWGMHNMDHSIRAGLNAAEETIKL